MSLLFRCQFNLMEPFINKYVYTCIGNLPTIHGESISNYYGIFYGVGFLRDAASEYTEAAKKRVFKCLLAILLVH